MVHKSQIPMGQIFRFTQYKHTLYYYRHMTAVHLSSPLQAHVSSFLSHTQTHRGRTSLSLTHKHNRQRHTMRNHIHSLSSIKTVKSQRALLLGLLVCTSLIPLLHVMLWNRHLSSPTLIKNRKIYLLSFSLLPTTYGNCPDFLESPLALLRLLLFIIIS